MYIQCIFITMYYIHTDPPRHTHVNVNIPNYPPLVLWIHHLVQTLTQVSVLIALKVDPGLTVQKPVLAVQP